MIWIERTLKVGNYHFAPGFKVYTTDRTAEAIERAIPGVFVLGKQQEVARYPLLEKLLKIVKLERG